MPIPLQTGDPDDPFAEQRHYAFAHQTIPAIFEGRPLDCARIRECLDGPRLRELWFNPPPLSRSVLARPVGLGYELIVLNPLGMVAAVFTLPRPWFTVGAYYVAALASIQTRTGETPGARIFTLERTHREGTGEAAILGSWEGGTHANFGNVPEISREAFLGEAVRRITPAFRAYTGTVVHRLNI